MPSRVKVTVSLDASLASELEKARRRSGKSRSRLMEEALQHWRRSQLERELREGYKAMAAEDRAVAEQHLRANPVSCAAWEVSLPIGWTR